MDHSDDITELERRLGYRFGEHARLTLALTHSSVAYEEQRERGSDTDNERLEFLGDAVLELVVTEILFRECPELGEGKLTRLRAHFVSRQHLGHAAGRLGLGEFLRLGKGEERSGGRRKSALLANALEAVIAAVYLDGGLQAAEVVVRRVLLEETLETLAGAARAGADVGDHKSSLQEYLQAHGLGQPRYEVTAETGPDHHKSFVVAVKIAAAEGERMLAQASGARKKQAEQEAARLALGTLDGGDAIP